MAISYSAEFAGIASLPAVKPSSPGGVGARVRRYRGTHTLATQLITDTLFITQLPAGAVFAYGVMTASVSLATSTLAIGIAGTAGKYRAAAVFTAVDTPTLFGPATILGTQTPLAASEDIIGTIAVASLPAAGTLVIDMYLSTG